MVYFFFISQLKIRDYFFLVQFYYYKTYLFQEFVVQTQDLFAIDSSKYFFKTVKQQKNYLMGSSLWHVLGAYLHNVKKKKTAASYFLTF